MIDLFDKNFTLLNRVKNNDFSDTYYKTVLPIACVQAKIKANDNATNSSVASHCYIYIHGNMLPKPYHTPKVWLSDTDKSLALTFKQDDYIVVGEISETSITDINSLYNKYDNVFKIYSVAYYKSLDSFQLKAK